MHESIAIETMNALGQETRLRAFRLLVKAGENGLAAGEIAEQLNVLPNTLSTNLAVLTRAGVIRSKREGRSIRYSLDQGGLRGFLSYLLEDCCGGRPEICGPAIKQISTISRNKEDPCCND